MLLFSGVAARRFLTFARFEGDTSASSHPSLMLVELMQLTDQFEGSLIRIFRCLAELLRQMHQAAKVIGNSELQNKFEKATEMLERPNSVIFCSSLYL